MVDKPNQTSDSGEGQRFSRRRFAQLAGAAGLAGVAGCTGGGDGGDGGGDGGDGSDGGDGGDGGGGSTPTKTTSQTQGNEAPSEIRVGGALSLTGPFSGTTPLYQAGYRTIRDWINNEGSPYDGKGIYVEKYDQKIPMKLIIYDDEANKQRSTNLYNRLIEQDNVHFLLGPYSSSITYTVGSTIERQGVPMVAAGAASPAVYNEVRDKWIHSVLSTVDKYNLGLIDAAARAPGDPVVRGIRENNEVNQISAKATEEYANQKGVDYKTVDTYEETTNDLSSSITKAASQNPDMIMNLGHQKTDQLLVDGVHSLGLELEAVGVGVSVAVKSFHEAMGVEKAQYVYGPQLWSPRIDAPNMDKFSEDFSAWYNEITGSPAQPDYHGGLAGVAIQVIKQTIEETGNLEREALRKTMANHEYTGTLNGDFTFGDNGVYQPQRSYGVQLQGEDLVPEIVAPEKFASAEPIWPAPNLPGQS